MSAIKAICTAGCGQQFTVTEMPTVQLGGGIEKMYFTCPHCQHEYLVSYTDAEIRKLQERIRRVQRRFANPHDNHQDARKKEARLEAQIKEKMSALRKRFEGS